MFENQVRRLATASAPNSLLFAAQNMRSASSSFDLLALARTVDARRNRSPWRTTTDAGLPATPAVVDVVTHDKGLAAVADDAIAVAEAIVADVGAVPLHASTLSVVVVRAERPFVDLPVAVIIDTVADLLCWALVPHTLDAAARNTLERSRRASPRLAGIAWDAGLEALLATLHPW